MDMFIFFFRLHLTLFFIILFSTSCSSVPSDTGGKDCQNYCCDSDTETTSDKSTSDSDSGAMETCLSGGNWYDEDTGFCWQNPPAQVQLNWYEASGVSHPAENPGGKSEYCGDLVMGGFDDWRLPNIDELRTLIKDCPVTETGGECPVTDGSVWSQETTSCQGCYELDEPGALGCYWDYQLGEECHQPCLSSSHTENVHGSEIAWGIVFDKASVVSCPTLGFEFKYLRCVRN